MHRNYENIDLILTVYKFGAKIIQSDIDGIDGHSFQASYI